MCVRKEFRIPTDIIRCRRPAFFRTSSAKILVPSGSIAGIHLSRQTRAHHILRRPLGPIRETGGGDTSDHTTRYPPRFSAPFTDGILRGRIALATEKPETDLRLSA
jgi:hypothetical protein